MNRGRIRSIVGFLAVGGAVFYIASALWDVYFIPSVPMARDWCKDWVDFREKDNPSAFTGCVEFKNDIEASKYYHNRRLVERNKWWLYGSVIAGILLAYTFLRAGNIGTRGAAQSSNIGMAILYGFLVSAVIPRVYGFVLPPPYKWFPAFLINAALERQRAAAISLGIPPHDADELVRSQSSE